MSNMLRTCNIIKDITIKYLTMTTEEDDDLNSKSKSLKTFDGLPFGSNSVTLKM